MAHKVNKHFKLTFIFHLTSPCRHTSWPHEPHLFKLIGPFSSRPDGLTSLVPLNLPGTHFFSSALLYLVTSYPSKQLLPPWAPSLLTLNQVLRPIVRHRLISNPPRQTCRAGRDARDGGSLGPEPAGFHAHARCMFLTIASILTCSLLFVVFSGLFWSFLVFSDLLLYDAVSYKRYLLPTSTIGFSQAHGYWHYLTSFLQPSTSLIIST